MEITKTSLKGLGAVGSLLIFGLAGVVLLLETRFLIPFLAEATGWETIIIWFIVAGLGMFLPLLIAAYIFIRKEGYRLDRELWQVRIRFQKVSLNDWMWGLGGIVLSGLMAALVMELLKAVIGHADTQPAFMSFEPLTDGRQWILLIWFPYWLLNIMGEEIFWRGVLLPRQEAVFGKAAWAFHGICWSIFHVAFGWQLLLSLIPMLFIQSYIVQRQKNSWVGVIIHAGINGPSFIAISLGLI